jgi:hypothetical protein
VSSQPEVEVHRPGATPRSCHRHLRWCLRRHGRPLPGMRTRGKGRVGRRRRNLQAARSSYDLPHADARSRGEELAARIVSAASCDYRRPRLYPGRCHGSSVRKVRRLAQAPTQGRYRPNGRQLHRVPVSYPSSGCWTARYRWSCATMEKSRASVGITRRQHGLRIASSRAAALPWRDAAVRPP